MGSWSTGYSTRNWNLTIRKNEYIHKPEAVRDNETHNLHWDFEKEIYHNINQTTRPSDSQEKKKTCRIVDIAVPEDHWVELKESEKWDKFLDLAKEQKWRWNMEVTVLLIVIGALGKILKYR